jgi:NIMA (never in mitosis gene a)-related kinase
MSQKEREQLQAEFKILSTVRHENIVAYYSREHLKTTQDLHLYMEYCGNGDLGKVIKDLQKKNEYAEETFVWAIFAQLVSALYRCHYGVSPPEVGKSPLGLKSAANPKPPAGGHMVLHRDLKPENGKSLDIRCITRMLTFYSVPRRRKLCEAGRLRFIQDDGQS